MIGVNDALLSAAAFEYLDFLTFFFSSKTAWIDWFLKEFASALKMQVSNNATL